MLNSRRISSLSPLADKINTTSPRRTAPTSPCTASAGERKWLGVPVDGPITVPREIADEVHNGLLEGKDLAQIKAELQ